VGVPPLPDGRAVYAHGRGDFAIGGPGDEPVDRIFLRDGQRPEGWSLLGFAGVVLNAHVSVPLFQGQFDATVSWTYNVGEGAMKSSTMLRRSTPHGTTKCRGR
jgi:hypothetical protein